MLFTLAEKELSAASVIVADATVPFITKSFVKFVVSS